MTYTPRVLLVDDNVELAEDLAEVLELSGAEVELARDGKDALERVASRAYDLVLTDMRMPRVSGLELVRALKGEHPETPVVVMTAYAKDVKLQEVLEHGALEVLEKPVDLDALGQLVEHLGPDRVSVLVVEDDASLRSNVVEALLGEKGMLPFPAHSVKHAEQVVETVELDVAIVDVRLPDESGLALARRLLTRGTPVIIATGYPSDYLEGGDEKPGELFEKPYEVDALLERVRDLSR